MKNMKKIQNIALAATMVPVLLFSSCSNDYLDRTPTTAMDTEVVLNDPSLVPTTVVGTMKMMWAYSTWGSYIPVLGDLMTDMVTSIRANQGTLQDMERWNITTNSTDAATFWAGPYQVAAAAARTIEASKRMLADSANLQLDASETNNLYSALATSLTIKVHAEYFLSQFFCIDVNETDVPGSNPTKVGLILLHDRALTNTEPANMSTLEATYQLMEKEIAEAIDAFGRSGSSSFTLQSGEARYYPTLAAAYMVQARVLLAQHKYEPAYTAAQNALDNLPSGANGTLISTEEGLLNAYGETPSSEDIWLLEYTSQDNLSANSLNNLFGSYGFTPTEKATDGVVICLPMVSGIITLSSSVRSVWRIMVPNESMTTTTLAAFNRGARRFASDKRRAFTVGASIRSSTFLSKSSSKWIFFSFSKKENHAFCCRHSSGTSVIRKNARNSASSSVDVSHCQ